MTERMQKLEEAIREAVSDTGLLSDWSVVAEVAEDGVTTLRHFTSENAVGWKAHGMALYLAAAHAPEPHYMRDEGSA